MNKRAFTLVELIVVITILAILGTIAFLSFQGYSKSSRDGVRVSDVNSMKKSLELFQIQTGKLPLPDNGVAMTYSGGTVWTQGTFGDGVLQKVEKLNKLPVDPLNGVEYTYSTTFSQKEYEIATILEGDLVTGINGVYAVGTQQATAYVSGNYNGLITKMLSGGTVYILAVPSIISRDIVETDIANLITSNELVFNGYSNLPSSYVNTIFDVDGGFDNNQTQIDVYSGTGMIDESGLQTFMQNLESAYSGTILADTNYIDQIIEANLSGDPNIVNDFGAELVNNSIGTQIQPTEVVGTCDTNPGYSNTSYTEGSPLTINVAWQNSNNTNPCYYECTGGYTGPDCSIAPPLISQAECTNAGWFWVTNSNDVYIGTNRGDGFCISPRIGDFGGAGGDGISYNGWGTSNGGWSTTSAKDTGLTGSAANYGQTKSLDSLNGYSCKSLGTSSTDFDTTDDIVGRMKWLNTNKANQTELQNIEWVINATPSAPHATPALFIADCLDGVKDMGTTMTYTHNNNTTTDITYSLYNTNVTTGNSANLTSATFQNRQKYLIGWTQKSGSHLPGAMSYIQNGYASANVTNSSGGNLTGNARGEYQIACELGALTDANDDTDNEYAWVSSIGYTSGYGWLSYQRTIGYGGCGVQSYGSSGSKSPQFSARFVIRP